MRRPPFPRRPLALVAPVASTTSRLLAALERTELVERDAGGGYIAGPLFALHAVLHDPWPQIARLARPVLEEVGKQTGETVHLGVRRGEDVVHIAQFDRRTSSRRATGTRSTCPRTARAWAGALRLRRPAPSLGTARTPHGPDGHHPGGADLGLTTIRRNRFATTVDELETGLTGIAAPVEGRDGVFAALGISGPTARLQDRADRIGRLLVEQADALSALLLRRTQHGPTGSNRSQEGAA